MERTRKRLKRNKLLAKSLTLVLLLAGFVTAAPAAAPPAAMPAVMKTAVQQEAKPVAPPREMPDYRYDPKGKIDPFKPFVRIELPTPGKKGPEKKKYTGNLTPLQRVALDKVRVTGIAGS